MRALGAMGWPAFVLTTTLLYASTANADNWQWKAGAGAELSSTTHAVIDLALRRGPLSIALQTDTLDIRYSPEHESGRWWLGGRVATIAAELFLSPWERGAPAPEQALRASYAGLDAGYVHYLPHAWYAGTRISARLYDFGELPTTTVTVPEGTHRVTPELLIGRWTETLKLELLSGVEWVNGHAVPYGRGYIKGKPSWTLSPLVAVYAGYSNAMPELARTRVGGLNPYVVPLAGAAWAEWWAERYIVARTGLVWTLQNLDLKVLYDLGSIDGDPVRSGCALGLTYRGQGWGLETSAAYALNIPRQPHVSAWSGWVALTRDWRDL